MKTKDAENNQKDPAILVDALLSLVENDNSVKKLTNKELADSIRRIFGDHLDITSRKFSLIEEAADRLDGTSEEVYYRIIGKYSKRCIGYCVGESGKKEVLREEPNAAFEECSKGEYEKGEGK